MAQTGCTFRAKNGKEILIRRIEPDDAENMVRFMHTVDGETRFLSREPGEFPLSPGEERSYIQKQSEDARAFWQIAEDGGRIVANCGVHRAGKYRRFLHRAGLGIVVAKEYWGLGIGGKLMRDAVAWCRENGIEKLELSVVTSNEKALALYRSLGFEIEGTCRRAMKYPDGTYADDYWMGLIL